MRGPSYYSLKTNMNTRKSNSKKTMRHKTPLPSHCSSLRACVHQLCVRLCRSTGASCLGIRVAVSREEHGILSSRTPCRRTRTTSLHILGGTENKWRHHPDRIRPRLTARSSQRLSSKSLSLVFCNQILARDYPSDEPSSPRRASWRCKSATLSAARTCAGRR